MAIGRDLTPAAAVVPSMVLVADPSAYVPEAEAGRLTARGFEVRRVPGAGTAFGTASLTNSWPRLMAGSDQDGCI